MPNKKVMVKNFVMELNDKGDNVLYALLTIEEIVRPLHLQILCTLKVAEISVKGIVDEIGKLQK